MTRFVMTWTFCFASCRVALAAPPEEIRIDSLGSRGVTFTDTLPGHLSELIAAAGDVNGDGGSDFLFVRHDTADEYEPTVYLIHGKPGLPPVIPTAEAGAFATVLRRSMPRTRGFDVGGAAPAGDIDRDGFDDFFVLRPGGVPAGWTGDPEAPGIVHLVHGSASLPAQGFWDASTPGLRVTHFTSTRATVTRLGSAAAAGDLNADGEVDLVLGASSAHSDAETTRYPPGRVYVLFGGQPFSNLVDVDEAGSELPGLVLEGQADGAGTGSQVLFPGDVNGDGIEDLLVGSRSSYGRDPGWVYLVLGGRSLPARLTTSELVGAGHGVRFTGVGPAAFTGEALAAPGDLNGDGLADFAVGANGASNQNGEAYVVHGQRSFDPDVALARIAADGLGVTFRGTTGERSEDHAGCALASVDFLGDGTPDLVVGAYGHRYRGIDGMGRVFIVDGRNQAPAVRPLVEVDSGLLAGAMLTREVSLEAVEAEQPWLGYTVAAPGDVDGDGRGDVLVSAPQSFNVLHPGNIHLVLGRGGSPDPLRLERVQPDRVAVDGGEELTLVGAGLDAAVEVRIGGAVAPVVRALTSARLVVLAPARDSMGPADVVVTRGVEASTLAGGVTYVARIHADIDVLALPAAGRGMVVHGQDRTFALSVTLADVDQDAFSDLIITNQAGSLTVIYGSSRPLTELALPDLEGGAELDGISLIRATPYARCVNAGDVNGDGRTDLAVLQAGVVTVLFPRRRFPARSDIEEWVAGGDGVDVLLNSESGVSAVAGGKDLDGDGIGDLLIGVGTIATVYFLPGRRDWPREIFLEDSARWTSSSPEDGFGSRLALPGDVDGDGKADALAGAPEGCCVADGSAYVLFGGDIPQVELVQTLLDRGGAIKVEPLKPRSVLGDKVCAPGDMNGDGLDDLAIGAAMGGIAAQGETYVVFGGTALRELESGVFKLAELGGRGMRILGEKPEDHDFDLAPAGDFNGDGLQDLLIGVPNPFDRQGRAYVVFGGPARTVRLSDLRDDGVRLSGASLYMFGYQVQGGGDFNGDGRADIAVANLANPPAASSLVVVFGEAAPGAFLRGDSNRDGEVQLSDAVHILGYLFLGSDPPACLDAADATDDGKVDLSDAVYVLSHLFLGGPPPAAPFPEIGADATPDVLDCKGIQ